MKLITPLFKKPYIEIENEEERKLFELDEDKEIERLNKVLEYLEKYFSNNQDYELAQLVRDTKQANIEWLEKVIGSDKE